MTGTVEPFGGEVLDRYYVKLGAKFDRQTGSHRFYRLPDGRMLGSTIGVVPSSLLRATARTLGFTYPELRARLGHPVTKSGKARNVAPAKHSARVVTKAQVVESIDKARALLAATESAVRSGQRDASTYARTWQAVTAASENLEAAAHIAAGKRAEGGAA